MTRRDFALLVVCVVALIGAGAFLGWAFEEWVWTL